MINQSLLESLKGLTLDTAKEIVVAAGHKAYPVSTGMAITMEVKPNTVILWHENNVVVNATSGG